ncbi:MAG: nickel transporter [Methanomicrobiales archaeon]|nr:nickel transporter [Methanomicrobiales archaeon]
MKLILAMDLLGGQVVHGVGGNRRQYRPLDWGCASDTDPVRFLLDVAPRYVYIADLDRITGAGDNDEAVRACAGHVEACFVDRGCRSPDEMRSDDRITEVIGTETAGSDLSRYPGGILSIDCRDGRVVPEGGDPVRLLRNVAEYPFSGFILLNISSVGTRTGVVAADVLEGLRNATTKPLFYGGGVASLSDLQALSDAGIDGAIVATAVHTGAIPLAMVRRGLFC